MKSSLAAGGPCRYWTERGRWQRGKFLSYDPLTRKTKVQPSRSDSEAIELPSGQVKPPFASRARQRTAIGGVLTALQDRKGGPAARKEEGAQTGPPASTVSRLDGAPRAVPRPPRRIVSCAYLRWIRLQPCCSRGAAAQAHHYGLRGVGWLADDPRTVPLCETCHLRYWHHDGTLPGHDTPEAARLFVLQQKVLHLLRYLTERGADAGELQLLLARVQVDALVLYFTAGQRGRRRAA